MTTIEIFFYIALPAAIVLAGWISVRLNERISNKHHTPAE